MGMSGRDDDPLRRYSPRLVAAFAVWLSRYLGRNFNAVRVTGTPPSLGEPTVLYSNHAAWWDPIVLLWVLGTAFPHARIFAPMQADALERYALFKRMGAFGIATGTYRGTARFLRTSRQVLGDERAVLCVTAEGAFSDPRARPVRLARGVSHLLESGLAAQAVPIAIEYPFWHERRPEALLRFGDPVRAFGGGAPRGAQQEAVRHALEHTLDTLAALSIARDGEAFVTLLDGARGVGGTYDLYRRARARIEGRPFDPSHGSLLR